MTREDALERVATICRELDILEMRRKAAMKSFALEREQLLTDRNMCLEDVGQMRLDEQE